VFFSAAAVAIFAPRFSESVLRAPHLVTGVRISAVSMLLLTINGYQVGAVAGLGRFRALALLGAAQGIATAVLVTVFALVMGLEGALLGYALAAAVTWALFRFSLGGECRRAGIEVRYAHMRRRRPSGSLRAMTSLERRHGRLGQRADRDPTSRGFAEMAALRRWNDPRCGAFAWRDRVSRPCWRRSSGRDARAQHRAVSSTCPGLRRRQRGDRTGRG
jgi:hypothetical protein